jgi:sulfate transport system permease protein
MQVGIKAAFGPPGIFIALVFIGLPFVVRTVQPVLEDLDRDVEEAAATLGASAGSGVSGWCCRLLSPAILIRLQPGLRPRGRRVRLGHLHRRQHAGVSEIAPLLIVIRLEEYDYAGAAAIGADAGGLLRHPPGRQPAAALEPQMGG